MFDVKVFGSRTCKSMNLAFNGHLSAESLHLDDNSIIIFNFKVWQSYNLQIQFASAVPFRFSVLLGRLVSRVEIQTRKPTFQGRRNILIDSAH